MLAVNGHKHYESCSHSYTKKAAHSSLLSRSKFCTVCEFKKSSINVDLISDSKSVSVIDCTTAACGV